MRYAWRMPALALLGSLSLVSTARGQTRPYIGYAYPAGGRQGTTVTVKLGGQGLDDVAGALFTGSGVTARVIDYHRKLGNQEMQLLREQREELLRGQKKAGGRLPEDDARLLLRLQQRLSEYVDRPACASIATLVFLEVAIAPGAEPGPRELRLVTQTGVSNPLVFHVGQLPEYARKALTTRPLQVLGKEEQALRTRPPEEEEVRIDLPCVVNGQIAPGEINAYRFAARKGQRLVLSVAARQLIPFVADAVPGWFQPVLVVYDADGREVVYSDDFRFMPDPTVCFEVPRDGDYRATLTDAIYRGREDFVYRMTVGELPYLAGVFPLGGPADAPPGKIAMSGWNLEGTELVPPPPGAPPGVHAVVARRRDGFVSNRVPFALDTLPEVREREPNNTPPGAQRVQPPVVINGRIDQPGDEDIFRVEGRPGDPIVADVTARALDSPIDAVLKVTDAAGSLLAFNDDHADAAAGTNTHHADPRLVTRIPPDGVCFIHLADTARQGGEAYAYRLRVSAPRPDFDLRVVPSSLSMRSKAAASLTVFVLRRDGFTGDISLGLKNPPPGFSAAPVTLTAKQESARLTLKNSLRNTPQPVDLIVEGRARIGDREVVRAAVPAEDRMQAFLWRHLVPAENLVAWVYDPGFKPPPKRVPPPPQAVVQGPKSAGAALGGDMQEMTAMSAAVPSDGMQEMTAIKTASKTDKPASPAPPPAKPSTAPAEPATATPTPAAPAKPATATPAAPAPPKFTKQQVAARLRQLKLLYEDWLLTDAFYARLVAECEAAQ